MFKKSIPKNWKKSQKKAEKLLSASFLKYFICLYHFSGLFVFLLAQPYYIYVTIAKEDLLPAFSSSTHSLLKQEFA